jgi:hypothetical protein
MNIPSMGQIIPHLAETNTAYALELQWHGRGTDIDRPITYENLAADVVGFMDAVSIEKASIFGCSWVLARRCGFIDHPERVSDQSAFWQDFLRADLV